MQKMPPMFCEYPVPDGFSSLRRANGAPEGFFRVQRKNLRATHADAGGAAPKPTGQRPAGRHRPGAVCAAAQIGREVAAAQAAAVWGGGRSPASPDAGGGKVDRVDVVDSGAQRTKLAALPPRERGGRQARHGRAAAQRAAQGKGGREPRRPAVARPGSPRQRAADGAGLVMTDRAGGAGATGAVSRATTQARGHA